MNQDTLFKENDIVIVIPTFERYKNIYHNTLSILRKNKTDFPIYIVVSNETEKQKYMHELSDYKKIDSKLYTDIIVSYTSGLSDKRNFITCYFKEGQYIIQMDDDIQEIGVMKTRKQITDLGQSSIPDISIDTFPIPILKSSMKPITTHDQHCSSFDYFCRYMFHLSLECRVALWGVYPIFNPYFMNNSIWLGQSYIVGAFFGVINTKNINLSNCLQEDKERSLKFAAKFGGVLRCNYISIKTNYWKNSGGMQSPQQLSGNLRNTENIITSLHLLSSEYPNQVRPKKTKHSSEFPDVSIINKISGKFSRKLVE